MHKGKYIIFFDGECPLCNRAVRFVLKADKKKVFLFAPLAGRTAAKELVHFQTKHPELDTFILLEGYQGKDRKILMEGRAVFRMLWLLGGMYRFPGCLSFLPSTLFDIIYRWIAARRYKLFKSKRPLPSDQGRFLD